MTLRQFLMLRFMAGHTYTVAQAIMFRQRTFGALCRHEWVNYNPWKKRFYVTRAGTTALRDEQNHTLHRRITSSMEFAESVLTSGVNVVEMRRAS